MSGRRIDESVGGALLRHRVYPHARRLHEEADILRRPGDRRGNQHRLIAWIGLARGNGVGIHLVGQPLERGLIEYLDVADDVRRPHQLTDRQRRLFLPDIVACEVLDIEASDRELVGERSAHGDATHVGAGSRWRLRQNLIGAKREVEGPGYAADHDIRRHDQDRRSRETVAVDHDSLGILVEARDATVDGASRRIRRNRVEH